MDNTRFEEMMEAVFSDDQRAILYLASLIMCSDDLDEIAVKQSQVKRAGEWLEAHKKEIPKSEYYMDELKNAGEILAKDVTYLRLGG